MPLAISGVQINISGGDVTASGIYGNGSVIVSGGGGQQRAAMMRRVLAAAHTVSGGDVTATGGYCGAGIGGAVIAGAISQSAAER